MTSNSYASDFNVNYDTECLKQHEELNRSVPRTVPVEKDEAQMISSTQEEYSKATAQNRPETIATSVSEVEGTVAPVQIRQSENPGTPVTALTASINMRPSGLNLTEEAIKKQRLCVLLVDGGSQALRYTISRIVLDMKLQNVDGQTRGKLCVSDKSLLYPAGSVLPSLDGLTQAGLDMVWTKALQQSPVTSGVTQDMIYDYLVSDGLDLQLKNNKQRIQELNNKKKLLSQGQWDILYPQLNATVDLESFDMTLLCFVILNVFQFKPTSGIWSQDPPAGDVDVGDDILRLRKQRNKLAHSSSTGMDDSTFQAAWTEIRDVLVHLRPGQEFSDRIQQLQLLDPEKAAESEQLIEDWINHDKQLEHLDSGCNYSLQEKITMSIIFGLVLVIILNFIICEDGQGGPSILASSLSGLFVIVIILQRQIRGFVDCGEGTGTTGEPFSRKEKSLPLSELEPLCHALYSVGLITITDSTPDSTSDSTGTGFVVGDGHLMTACHVISEQIENILATITQIVSLSKDNDFESWKTRFLGLEEMEPYLAVKRYFEESETNLEKLISSFEEYITKEDNEQLKQVLNKKWHDAVTVEFDKKNSTRDKYMFSPNIPFLNKNIDVAILKIQSDSGRKLPESLPLTDSAFHHEKVNIIGYIKKNELPELALDPKCEVYTKSFNLEKNVEEAINWWKEKEREIDNRNEGKYDKIDFEGEYKDCVIKDSEVLLHASPSFVHGTSGSPMIGFKEDGTTVVVGIYLRGYPMFYYKIKKAIENRIRLTGDLQHFNKLRELVRQNENADESDKIIEMRYFIEGGTTMKNLADRLPVSAIRDKLFPNRSTEGQRTPREEESDSGEQFRFSTDGMGENECIKEKMVEQISQSELQMKELELENQPIKGQMTENLSQAELQVKELELEIERVKGQMAEQVSQSELYVKQLQLENEQVKGQMTEQLSQTEFKIKELEFEKEQVKGQNFEQLSQMELRVKDLEIEREKLQEVGHQVKELELENEQLKTKINESIETQNSLKRTVEDMTVKSQMYEETVQYFQEEGIRQDAEKREFEKEIEDLKATVSRYFSPDSVQGEIETQLQRVRAHYEVDLNAKDLQLQALTEEFKDQKKQLDNQMMEVIDLRRKLEEKEQCDLKLQQYKETTDKYESPINALKNEINRLEEKQDQTCPTDCIVEGEVLKLGGPFLKTWQKKHLKLYPNRLEFYQKNRDGQVVRGKAVEMISMLDIKEVYQDFQKLNKTENCIVIVLINDTKLVITSPYKVLINQWKDEIILGYKVSAQIMANMNPKASKMYGAAITNSPSLENFKPPLEHRNSNGS